MKITFLFKAFLLLSLLTPVSTLAWECDVTVSGPNTVKLDQPITLSALGTPTGGSYSWSRTPNLVPNGATATLTGFIPTYSEYIKVIGYYTSPKGKKCSDTKWLWACVCNVTSLNGPAEAKVGEQVTLTAQADPTGGTYTWTVNSGTGTITPSDSSAVFVGDSDGPVEIKVSYVPPDGGEPCEEYHTIQVNGDCQVTLTKYELQRPVCRAVNFTAQGTPAGGTCNWTAGNGISGTGCNAEYTAQIAGNDAVIVTYITPDGAICDDSKNVLSYSLDGMVANKMCFSSGAAIQGSDFDFYISPASFSFGPILSPTTVTTDQPQAQVKVAASPVCDSGSTNVASTVVNVVNKENKDSITLEFSIPESFKTPLKTLGIAEQLTLSTSNSYSTNQECCVDEIVTSSSGSTGLSLKTPTLSIPIAGIPMPKKIEKYVKANISVVFSGGASSAFKGEYKGCEKATVWTGEGNVNVNAALNGGANATMPKVFVIGGEAEGSTSITESLQTISNVKLRIATNWGGLTGKVAGFVEIPYFNLKAEFDRSKTYFEADNLLPFDINLPVLGY